jgi:hypothetical protein
MSPTTRDVTKHAKARQRRRLKAPERLERDRRQAQRAAEALQQALEDLGLPENLVAELESRLRSQQQLLGNICGVMFPPCSGAVSTQNCAACGAGTRTCPHACAVRCPRAPGSSGADAWAWRCWSRCGATLPASVRPRAAAGSRRGWAMTRYAKRMASRGASWALGGVARQSGGSPVLMACAWSWSSARARWSSPAIVLSVGQTPRALEGRVGTNGAGWRACWMGAWRPNAGAAWRCPRRWSWPIVRVAMRRAWTTGRRRTRAPASWKEKVRIASRCQTGARSRGVTCRLSLRGPGVTAHRSLGCALHGCGPPVRRLARGPASWSRRPVRSNAP